MEKIIGKPLQKKKKVSLDIDESLLSVIDGLANLTETSRTNIIETTIGKGYTILVGELETAWNSLLAKGELNEEKKKKVKKLLIGLKNLCKGE